MSQKRFNQKFVCFPEFADMSTSGNALPVINATGETIFACGHIALENPDGGSKTISAAGGGSIVVLLGTVTFANAGSTFDVGIQDISTATNPMQGDGTFDVKASFTGGGGGITGSAFNTCAMTSGTKTLAHGDIVAIGFAMTARAGADSIVVSSVGMACPKAFPASVTNASGPFTRIASCIPAAYIIFDDGSIGWIYGAWCHTGIATQTYNLNTATADEYGNLIMFPGTVEAEGISVVVTAGATADFEVILYSDPLGTPVAERVVSIDSTYLAGSGFVVDVLFPTRIRLRPNIEYAVTVRPTTTTNISTYSIDTDSVSGGGKIHPPNSTAYAIRRLDNAGAFSDYNNGTAKTRLFKMSVFGSYMEQGINNSFNQLGI